MSPISRCSPMPPINSFLYKNLALPSISGCSPNDNALYLSAKKGAYCPLYRAVLRGRDFRSYYPLERKLIALYIGLFSNCIYHSSISEYHMNSLFSTVNLLKSGTTLLTKSPSKPHIYVILYFFLYYAFGCPTFFYPTYFLRFRA